MIFEFYWSYYEDYRPYIFEGDDKTREEFEADCNKALKESFNDYIVNIGDIWASLPDWMKYAIVKMEDYGYTLIKPLSFGYFGLYLPKSDKYCKENDEIRDKSYQERFPEFLDEIKKMIEHNDIVDKKLDEEDKENKDDTDKTRGKN